MTVSGPSFASPRSGDFTGAVVNLVASRGVASVQFAAAAKLLKLGAAMDAPAAKLAQSAAATMDARGDALAALATGLGQSLDVYA